MQLFHIGLFAFGMATTVVAFEGPRSIAGGATVLLSLSFALFIAGLLRHGLRRPVV